jgi:hypothetical protein
MFFGTAKAQGGLTNEEVLSRLAGVWTLVDWDETLSDTSFTGVIRRCTN